MHVNTQISRGMERIMARNMGDRMDGLFGLSGLGACESFTDLEEAASDAGVPNASAITRKLRGQHKCACKRLRDALPVAMDVKNLIEASAGPGPATVSQQLGALGSSAAKVAAKAQKAQAKLEKKIAKVQAKEAKQEAKVAAKVAKLEAAGKSAKGAKVLAKDAKQDAKVAAKLVKLDTKLQTAKAAVANAVAAQAIPATAVTTPTETAAAVLANQANVQATTPQAQQLMQEVVANATQPGSTVPTQSLSTQQYAMPVPQASSGAAFQFDAGAPATQESDGGFFANVPPLYLAAGAGAVLLLVLAGKRRAR